MSTKRVFAGSRSLVTLFDSGTIGSQSDRDLLECFQTDSGPVGQEAFRILVERHGPMVLGLCRSLVRDQHEAEDAFQATFLVLVRKAGSIQRRDTLGPWIFGVAAKVARRARSRLNLRRKREASIVADIAQRDRPFLGATSSEQLLHEEIARLPQSIQKPLILCCLQGLSYDLAAQQLRVNPSTVRGRLERARKRLSARLRERGAMSGLSAPALDSVRAASPPLPSTLIESTVQFSLRWSRVTGLLGGGAVIPETVSALAQGAIQSMLFQTLRVSAAALLAAGAIGTVVVAQQGKGQPAEGAAARPATDGADSNAETILLQIRPESGEDLQTTLDAPDGLVTYVDYEKKEVTVGINRGMGARPKLKFMIFKASSRGVPTEKPKGRIELTSVGEKSSHARIIETDNPIDPIRVGDIVYSPVWSPNGPTRFALMGKIDVNRDGKDDRDELKRMIEEAGGVVDFDVPPPDVGKETGELTPRIDWYVTDDRLPFRHVPQANPAAPVDKRVREVIKEARLNGIRPMTIGKLLAYLGHDMNAPLPRHAEAAQPDAQSKKPSDEEKNARINQKLDMVTGADFPKTATLGTLLKQIRQTTTDANYHGIPIYVDPTGLEEAKTTVEANIIDIPQAQPIGAVLRHCLRPLGLAFDVRDGFLMVSSRMDILENRVEEIDRKLDRLIELLDRPQPAK